MSPRPSAAGARRSSPLRTHRLSRGLRVHTVHREAPVTALYLWIGAGSVDEQPDEHGLAHFLEHMLFKGTARHGVGELAHVVEALGGDLNAWTSTDETVYHATVLSPGWRQAVGLLAEMVTHPTLDPEEFDREVDVILEEIRAWDDAPDSRLSDAIQAALWGGHPYGRRVVGTADTVRGYGPDDLAAFLRREVVQARARLVVVGPCDHAEVVQAAERAFADWAGGTERTLPEPPPLTGDRLVRIRGDFPSTAVELTWRLPPAGHPDLPALTTLAQLLGQGAGARLTTELQRDEHLAFGVWASTEEGLAGSTFSVGFVPMEGRTIQAVATTLDTLDQLARAVPADELSRARAAMAADDLFAAETVDDLAHDLAWYDALYGDPHALYQARRAIARLTPADVAGATGRWLTRDRAVLGVLGTPAGDAALRDLLAPRPPRRPRTSGPQHHTVGHGTRVVVCPETSPLVAVRLLSLGGGLRENVRHAGLSAAWSRAVLGGAGPFDATALAEQADRLAATLDPLAGPHTTGLQLTVPSDQLEPALELLGDLATDPHFERDEVDRVLDELADDLRTLPDRPEESAAQALSAAAWAGHPWRLPSLGTPASLRRLGPRVLRRWHDTHLAGPGLVVSAVGGVEPQRLLECLAWLEDLPRTPAPLPPRPTARPRLGRTLTLHAGHEQALVRIALRGVPLRHDDELPLLLATGVLDGQAGRLFLRLREQAALAYDVWAQSGPGLDGGLIVAGLATAPERLDAATAALRQQLQGLADAPPRPDELHRARQVWIGQFATAGQRITTRAARQAAHLLLRTPLHLDRIRQRLEAITPAQVQDAWQRALAPGTITVKVLPLEPPG